MKLKEKTLKIPKGEKVFKKISNITITVIAVVITIIAMANLQPVTIKLLFFTLDIPLIILILILLITGFLAGYILKGVIDYRKDR
ncbi:MAG TPA: lipopolysaccharide assembly protein LapA domain-containing protein [Spirochaetota bacterium]|nr:lipopolysaccharide assembly protein LapA domain-containing protein [Spirochaetota bacterium]